MRRVTTLLVAFFIVLTIATPAAEAATVECEELNPRYNICEVVFIEEPGERNRLQVSVSGNEVRFRDQVRVLAGRQCVQLDARRATCPIGSEPVKVRLGRNHDSMEVRGAFGPGPALQAELGRGDDVFVGGRGSEGVDGGRGADRIFGRGGDDSLIGGESGRDVIEGGAGHDLIEGGNGSDRLVGGPGRDSVVGGGGQNRIDLRDGSIDEASCGMASVGPLIDLLDWISFSCRVRPRPRAAAVPLGRDIPEADLDFKDHLYLVGCPADGPRPCRGRVEIRDGRRLLLVGRFRARRGSRVMVTMREPAGFIRPAEARRVLARATVLSRDRVGRRAEHIARVPFLIDSEEGIE